MSIYFIKEFRWGGLHFKYMVKLPKIMDYLLVNQIIVNSPSDLYVLFIKGIAAVVRLISFELGFFYFFYQNNQQIISKIKDKFGFRKYLIDFVTNRLLTTFRNRYNIL